jgi:demethylmacrocin O-methyltransferase
MPGRQLVHATKRNPSVHASADCQLDVLAKKYRTDKSTDHNGYVLHYEQHLSQFRDRCVRLLELGVHDGRSLRMWAEYFPWGLIYGVDVDQRSKGVESGRIKVFLGDLDADETYPSLIEWAGNEKFDIILDDASHRGEQQRNSFEHLFPMLSPGGFYIIEDMGTSYWSGWGGGLGQSGTSVDLVKRLVDSVNSAAYRDTEDSRTFGSPRPGDVQTELEKSIYAVYVYKYVTFVVKAFRQEPRP